MTTDGTDDSSSTPTSGITRRKFLAGGTLAIGTSAVVGGTGTTAAFRDAGTANGDLQVASLDRSITDRSSHQDGVEYEISYQVTMGSGFDGLDLVVERDGSVVATYTDRPMEDVVTYDGSSLGGGPTYTFTFEVYAAGSPNQPVITESVTDEADGTDPSDNDDLGGPDDPVLESFTVADSSTNTDGTRYDVSWQVSNTSGFAGFVRVKFRNTGGNDYGNRTYTDPNVANGAVSYPQSGSVHANYTTFEITVEVVKDNGIVVDSGSVLDDPDGNDTHWNR